MLQKDFSRDLSTFSWAKTPTTSVFVSLDSGHGCLVVGYCPKQQTNETIDPQTVKASTLFWAVEYHTLVLFLKGTIMK